MHIYQKPQITPLTIILLFVLFPKLASAQSARTTYGNANPVVETMNIIKVNKEFKRKAKMGSMMDSEILGTSVIYNSKYAFDVSFKDGTQKKVYSNIYFDTLLRKCYLVSTDKKFPKSDSAHRTQIIYPDQTLKISRVNYGDKVLAGMATDSCWMFKIASGQINAYSYLSEESGPNFNNWTIIGIQLNNGPIIKYSEENLVQMVGQYADALTKIKDKDYLQAIKKYNRNAEKAAKK